MTLQQKGAPKGAPADSVMADLLKHRDEIKLEFNALLEHFNEQTKLLINSGQQQRFEATREALEIMWSKHSDIQSRIAHQQSQLLAEKQHALSERTERFNWILGFFVIVSAFGTGVQAWAAWEQNAAAHEAARDALRLQQPKCPDGGAQ